MKNQPLKTKENITFRVKLCYKLVINMLSILMNMNRLKTQHLHSSKLINRVMVVVQIECSSSYIGNVCFLCKSIIFIYTCPTYV